MLTSVAQIKVKNFCFKIDIKMDIKTGSCAKFSARKIAKISPCAKIHTREINIFSVREKINTRGIFHHYGNKSFCFVFKLYHLI